MHVLVLSKENEQQKEVGVSNTWPTYAYKAHILLTYNFSSPGNAVGSVRVSICPENNF